MLNGLIIGLCLLVINPQEQDDFPPSEAEISIVFDYMDSADLPVIKDSGRFTNMFMSYPSLTPWINHKYPVMTSIKVQDASFDFDDKDGNWFNQYRGDLFKTLWKTEFVLLENLSIISEVEFSRLNTDDPLVLTEGAIDYLGSDELESGISDLMLAGKYQLYKDYSGIYVSAFGGIKIPIEKDSTFDSSESVDYIGGLTAGMKLFGGYLIGGASVTVPNKPDVFEADLEADYFFSGEISYLYYLGWRFFTSVYVRSVQSPFDQTKLLERYDVSAGVSVRALLGYGYSVFAGYSRGLTGLAHDDAVTVGITVAFSY